MLASRFGLGWIVVGLQVVAAPVQAHRGNPLPRLLRADATRLGRVGREPGRYRLQVLSTRIDRDARNRPHFRTFRYGGRPRQYFYPASTVKLPAAVLALQKLRGLRYRIPGLTLNSPLRIDSTFVGQTRVERDTSSATGKASIGQYISKVLLVSDNDTFNRLYEFVASIRSTRSCVAPAALSRFKLPYDQP
ncbi:hypothetical protein [Hymenobacter persicinus]|uniref:Serine hydrolase n=1 Tax=Hymenobacter persicinus TaxID=2025506 RepID=A0A4Q5LCS2_9BACT|nr:hypothetical protein [Hymenobacter persicinus]RYU79133.1 hypothetical protein EWM57_11410 [Hymenobacter persicinus]